MLLTMQTLHVQYRQFTLYLLSGGTALLLALGVYYVLLRIGIWYISASLISDAVGFLSAFVFHKYMVFLKRENTAQQMMRYTISQIANAALQTLLIYIFVEYAMVEEFSAKIAAIALSVIWNFFVYKFLVYV